jgi:hypothetical protein
MASTVRHLRSSTADKRPTASGLADGQLAINTASGTPGLFLKDNAGAVVKVGPVHVGAAAPNATPAGSSGNSKGELWVNDTTTIHGLNYYTGSAFVNLTPSGTATTAGLVELATNAETQAGTDTVRAVTPFGLQSKVSDSTSTTSSTTIASSTAVKAAFDLANAALPKSGGRVTGNLEIGPTGSLSFEGSTDDNFETFLAVVDPTADRTITFPNVTGTVVTTGDTGTVTSTMITDGTIVNADINASAGIVDTKLATISTAGKVSNSATTAVSANTVNAIVTRDGSGNFSAGTITAALTGNASTATKLSSARTFAVTGDITGTVSSDLTSGASIATSIAAGVIIDADINASAAIGLSKLATGALPSGITVASANIVDGTIVNADVNASAAIAGTKISPNFGSQNVVTTGTNTAASLIPTGSTVPTNGVYLPSENTVGVATNGTGRLFINSTGQVGIGGSPSETFEITGSGTSIVQLRNNVPLTTNDLVGAIRFYKDDSSGGAGITSSIESKSEDSVGNACYLAFSTKGSSTAASEKLRITSAGLVGIGTSSPDEVFECIGNLSGFKLVGNQLRNVDFGQLAGDSGLSFRRLLAQSGGFNSKLSIGDKVVVLGQTRYVTAINSDTEAQVNSAWSQTFTFGTAVTIEKGVSINTDSIDRLHVNAQGLVGIGTTSPSSLLHVQDAGVTTLIVANTSNSSGVELSGSATTGEGIVRSRFNNSQLLFATAGASGGSTERARIDSSGRLLVGTSSARSNFFNGFSSWTPQHQIETAGSSSVGVRSVSFTYGRSNGDAPIFAFAKHRSDSIGGTTVVQSGDGVGIISFQASDGTDFVEAANISAVVDGTPGASDMPGRLVFSTTADGASSPTERMRIDSAGRIFTNASAVSNAANFVTTTDGLRWVAGTSTTDARSESYAGSTATRYHHIFSNPNGAVGSITTDASATAYNTSSDYRLKENVTAVTDGITRLQQLKPSRFNFIADPDKTIDGFLAHEVQDIVPEAITGEKDAVDDDGNPEYQGIDQSKLVPLLTAALQEAVAKIESLEARLTAAGL